MCSGSLGDFAVWLRLDRMDEIWEEDGILDEENRDVVSNDILTLSAATLRSASG